MLMKNNNLCRIMSFIIIFMTIFSAFPIISVKAETPKKVKIGLFYGENAKDYYTVSSEDGVSISLSNDESTSLIFADSSISSVTVKKNTFFSLEHSRIYPDMETAMQKVDELKAEGEDAFCSVSGNIYSVRTGLYSTFEEAQEASIGFGNSVVAPTSSGILVFVGDDIKIAVDDIGRHAEIAAISGNISLNSVPYRGAIRFLRSNGNDMAAVNVLGLEEYLYSVVPKEVSASWNEEVLKAQAVAARTFTITNLNKFKKYGFNLDNTTASQVYGGVGAEHPRTTAAVDATKGEIVLYDGKPASIYYHATSGGRTANSEDVWSTALPYLRSVEDVFENPDEATSARWSVTFTKEELKTALAARGIDLGDIEDVTVEHSDGRAIKLTFIGTKGSKTYSKDNIRVPLSLKSTNFVLIKSGDKTETEPFLDSFENKSENALKTIGAYVSGLAEKLIEKSEKLSASQEPKPASFTFSGGGWGHGVGMSQWGAKGMADNGFTYKEILTHYFTGVQVDIY